MAAVTPSNVSPNTLSLNNQGANQTPKTPEIAEKEKIIEKIKALRSAAALGDVSKVQDLLASGIDVNTYWNSQTPILVAAQYGHIAVIELLLKKNPYIFEARGHFKKSVFSESAYHAQLETFNWLYDHLIQEENEKNIDTLLHALGKAIEAGNLDILKLPLSKKFFNRLNYQKYYKVDEVMYSTLFHDACSAGHNHIFEFLRNIFPEAIMEIEQSLLATQTYNGNTILHRAVSTPKMSIKNIQTIYEAYPPSIASPNSKGQTPVEIAFYKSSFAVFEYLLNKFPKALNTHDKDNNNFLHGFFTIDNLSPLKREHNFNQEDFSKKLQLIITLKPELLNERNNQGFTPFHLCIREGWIYGLYKGRRDRDYRDRIDNQSNELCQIMLKLFPTVIQQCQEPHQNSPLFIAIREILDGFLPSDCGVLRVKFLYQANPEALTIKNTRGVSPLDLLCLPYVSPKVYINAQEVQKELLKVIFSLGAPYEILRGYEREMRLVQSFERLFSASSTPTFKTYEEIKKFFEELKLEQGHFDARSITLKGNTALHVSIQNKHHLMTYELLSIDANPNIPNDEGKTAKDIATENAASDPLGLLIIQYMEALDLWHAHGIATRNLKQLIVANPALASSEKKDRKEDQHQTDIDNEQEIQRRDYKLEFEEVQSLRLKLFAMLPTIKMIVNFLDKFPSDIEQDIWRDLSKMLTPQDENGELLPTPEPLAAYQALCKVDESLCAMDFVKNINQKKYALLMSDIVLVPEKDKAPKPQLRSEIKVDKDVERCTLIHKIKFLWLADPKNKNLGVLFSEYVYGRFDFISPDLLQALCQAGLRFHQEVLSQRLENNLTQVMSLLEEQRTRQYQSPNTVPSGPSGPLVFTPLIVNAPEERLAQYSYVEKITPKPQPPNG